MKKLLFALLIIAAAGAAFFLLQKKDSPFTNNDIQKEWILGKWKLDSVQPGKDSNSAAALALITMLDSNIMNYQYEFTKQGTILLSLGDSLSPDSSRYEWGKDRQLLFKDNTTDSTADIMKIARLNKDSLQLMDKDSSVMLFTRVK
jgi:hypothetical protein